MGAEKFKSVKRALNTWKGAVLKASLCKGGCQREALTGGL